MIAAFCKKNFKKKVKLKTEKSPVQSDSTVFTVQLSFDRFSDKVNNGIEPDRCHGRSAVQPAGPVRFSKHCLQLIRCAYKFYEELISCLYCVRYYMCIVYSRVQLHESQYNNWSTILLGIVFLTLLITFMSWLICIACAF